MCLAVGKLSEDEDVVITGSKDHYIKVKLLVCHILGVMGVLPNISFNVECYQNHIQQPAILACVICLNVYVPMLCA
jgi:hypothetical protein